MRHRLLSFLILPLLCATHAGGEEERLRAVVEFLSSVDSRISGYPGADRAADFVEEQFRRIGLEQVTVEDFEAAVPVDLGAELIERLRARLMALTGAPGEQN